jgi:hypothetical protein
VVEEPGDTFGFLNELPHVRIGDVGVPESGVVLSMEEPSFSIDSANVRV